MDMNTLEERLKSMSLSEFATVYENDGYDALEIIRLFIIAKDAEIDAISMVSSLASSKANKLSKQLGYIRDWIPNIVDMKEANPNLPTKVAKLLNRATSCNILGLDLSPSMVTELQKVVPEMDLPTFIFLPMVKWLNDKYNIYFKDQK